MQSDLEYALVIEVAAVGVTGAIILFKAEVVELSTALTDVITTETGKVSN